ncbi:hypothetical protein KY317_00850 [Candidatus Woesearchaeota archaeon]|nr:hypothetical protein [Candidatus Woesearchaeota archaeon]
MGSYDTGESFSRPRPAEREPREPRTRVPGRAEELPDVVDQQSNYNSEYKTIVALGGGLTPDRIVHPLPEDVIGGDLTSVVKYLTGDDIAERSEDRAIVEAIRNRMQSADYRVIINETLNFHNNRMTTPLTKYLVEKTQEGEDGEIKYNFADLAIVSHDEGGRTLDYLV